MRCWPNASVSLRAVGDSQPNMGKSEGVLTEAVPANAVTRLEDLAQRDRQEGKAIQQA